MGVKWAGRTSGDVDVWFTIMWVKGLLQMVIHLVVLHSWEENECQAQALEHPAMGFRVHQRGLKGSKRHPLFFQQYQSKAKQLLPLEMYRGSQEQAHPVLQQECHLLVWKLLGRDRANQNLLGTPLQKCDFIACQSGYLQKLKQTE